MEHISSQNQWQRFTAPIFSAGFRFLRARVLNLKDKIRFIGSAYKIIQGIAQRYCCFFSVIFTDFESHYLRPAKIQSLQESKLKKIFEFSFENIPFYFEKFNKIQINPESIRLPKDISKLPVTTKVCIRKNFPDKLLKPNKTFSTDLLSQTSGSTAESIHHLRPNNAWKRTLINSVISQNNGWLSNPIFVFSTPHCTGTKCEIADPEVPVSIPLTARFYPLRHLSEMIPLSPSGNILGVSDDYFNKIIQILNKSEPMILVGDPVYLSALAWYIKLRKVEAPKARFILTSYELLTESTKNLLGGVFNCPIHTQYGGSEILGVGNTCEHNSLHEMPKNVFFEIIKNNRPALPGEIGKILLTDLTNYNMPLIRYDIGDAFEPVNGLCPCGRKTRRLGIIHGRVSDLFKTGGDNAKIISPKMVDSIFNGVQGVKYYRLIQKQLNYYDISILPSHSPGDIDVNTIRFRAKNLLGNDCQFKIRPVRILPAEKSLKFRFSYSELEPIQI